MKFMSGFFLVFIEKVILFIYIYMFACWHACVNAWTNADKVLMCELLQTLKCTQTHTFS